MRVLTVLAGALVLSGCAAWQPAPAVPDEVRQALATAGLSDSAMGIVAYPLHARGRVMRLNADTPMRPASTMKLVTAAVALDKLGPNARGRTDLLLSGLPVDGVLAGPLYLRGGADTDLDWAALGQLLRDLRESGVREIQGGLVVDRSLFRPGRLDIGVLPFDSSPEAYYNAIPDALALNGQLLKYTMKADASGVQVSTSPAWPGLLVDSSALRLNELPCKDWEKEWQTPLALPVDAPTQTQRVVLRGAFPRACTRTEEFTNLFDRQWLTAQAVRQIWRELGGTMGGSAATDREATTPAEAKVVASHLGRPLAEVMRGLMKRSDNDLTRATFLRLGAAAAREGEPTLAAADRVVREWLAAKGVDAEGLVLENGSGLSRLERIKPAQLAALLQASWDGPTGPELLSTLPVAGVDGTLRNRMKGTAAQGQARMKTGTLRDTFCLAGYVFDSQNRPWVVVAMVNDAENGAKGRAALDALAAWVARQ